MKTFDAKNWKLDISEPILLKQGEPGDQVWGHYQFPNTCYTLDGQILAAWEYGTDNITYNALTQQAISADGGQTWRDCTDEPIGFTGYKMPNGKYFKGFKVKGAHKVDYLDKYTPAAPTKDGNLYFLEDVKEPEDTKVWASEYDPATCETTEFEVKINWPFQHLHAYTVEHYKDFVYPATMVFALCNKSGMLELDGDMYFVTYSGGFDSEAKTREEAIYKYCGVSSCYVFRSSDSGHTWDFVSQVKVDDEIFANNPAEGCPFEGLDEPMMEKMPDGSVVMLIRTGSDNPCYITRSTDNCKTWSKPQIFDRIGVYPQILTLDCGVTIASYGRPSLKVRATADPAGLAWEEPTFLMDREDTRKATSCCYTKLLALDDKSALLIYSDFATPHPSGDVARAIMVRKLTVVEEN